MRRGKDYDYAYVAQILAHGEKICTECKTLKPLSDFSKRPKHPTGHKSSCKACDKNRFAAWKNENLLQVRASDMLSYYQEKYGMSLSGAREHILNRAGECEICGIYADLVLDHDHKTSAMRGKICNSCNRILGFVKDDIKILSGMISYLVKYSGESK